MTFFNIDIAELESYEPLFFIAKTPVEMTILSATEQPKYGNVKLTCNVETGEHAGKHYELTISGNDAAPAKKRKAQFLLAFWSKEELTTGKASLDTLIGQRFQVRPEAPFQGKNGQTYQNFNGFLKLTKPEETPATATPF